MTNMRTSFSLAMLGIFLVLCSQAKAEVVIKQAEDRSVTVSTSVYTAAIDGKGNLTEVLVKGAKSFSHLFENFETPKFTEPHSVNLVNNMVAVRSGGARVEWTFGEETIHVVTDGYAFDMQLDKSVKAVVVPGGKGGPAATMYANSTAIVLANGLTVSYTMPFHAGAGRMAPTPYCNGSIQKGKTLEFDFKLGAPVDAVELLSAITIAPVGSSYGNLSAGGNQGYGMVHFPDPAKIAFTCSQQNLSPTDFALEYRLTVRDHYVVAREAANQKQPVKLAGNGKAELSWQLPALPAGFYYLAISAWRGETKLTESTLTFTVDLNSYRPPLTRPADFKAFWERQNQKLKDTPMNPVVTQVSDPANPNKAYEFVLDMPGNFKLRGYLAIPAKLGKGPAGLFSHLQPQVEGMISDAKKPGWDPKSDTVICFIIPPESATYTRWTSAEDNNLLQCILCYVRAVDFLATRAEVDPKRIMTHGASRSGPLAFISAALRPQNVCGVDANVATSAGISWIDKPYYAWGAPCKPDNRAEVERMAKITAYLDPVNHAPDVACPFVLGYGVDDTLAQPQGIEAMYQLSPAKWKRISRDQGGHQLSNGMQQIEKELNLLLSGEAGTAADTEGILKQH